MRLSLEKGAHAVLSSVAWQESGVLCALGKGWDTRRSVSRFVAYESAHRAALDLMELHGGVILSIARNSINGKTYVDTNVSINNLATISSLKIGGSLWTVRLTSWEPLT
jgi:hypothetical protein